LPSPTADPAAARMKPRRDPNSPRFTIVINLPHVTSVLYHW
jgi:hypothetical protein